ncbi:MAG: flagellar biosynthetic protein FliR [Proteobacteria bacterium]|nr:flagellar biosynthetic protein FliR [Pseudomonadota bacterium]
MTFDWGAETLVAAALGGVRMLALLYTAPVFGGEGPAASVRLGLAMWLAAVLSPGLELAEGWEQWGPLQVAGALLQEALIGAVLGTGTLLVFSTFLLFGEFISIQGGLGAARVIDPTSGTSSVALSQIFYQFSLLIYLTIDGHHELLRSAAMSFEVMPIASAGLDGEALPAVVLLAADVFEMAVRLAAPVTVSMFISNLGVGVLARAMPQLNLMTLQLPVQMALLLVIVGVGGVAFVDAIGAFVAGWPERVLGALLGLG